MRVQMLRSENGSPDGAVTKRYLKDTTPDLPQELADVFIEIGAAKSIQPVSNKDRGAAPQNKSAPAVAPSGTFPGVGGGNGGNSRQRAKLTIGGPRQG